MCTVSFIATPEKVIITSNRDEKTDRSAITPLPYRLNGKNMVFPKDPLAGGTWFATDEDSNVIVLLNGAEDKHIHNPPYAKSRGLILLDIASAKSPLIMWKDIDLQNIEPFTLILFQQKQLFQLRWNGFEKETLPLDPTQNYIWSSATLYSETIREQRSAWFADFIYKTAEIQPELVVDFHQNTQKDDNENGLVIDRKGNLKTLSITQAIIDQNKVTLRHHDLVNQIENIQSFITI